MCENYGACKDGVVVLQEIGDLEVHHPFNGVSLRNTCILLNDILLIYDLPSDYYNKMSPINSLCIRNCVLNLESTEARSNSLPNLLKAGKASKSPSPKNMKVGGKFSQSDKSNEKRGSALLSIKTANQKLVIGFPELHAMKEFVQYISDASTGSNNSYHFIDNILNPALTAADRQDYIRNMKESDFYPDDAPRSTDRTPGQTPTGSGRRMSVGSMVKAGAMTNVSSSPHTFGIGKPGEDDPTIRKEEDISDSRVVWDPDNFPLHLIRK